MNEHEYIIATDIARVRAAMDVVRSFTTKLYREELYVMLREIEEGLQQQIEEALGDG